MELCLLSNNRKLSSDELATAKIICDESLRDLIGRPAYIRDNAIDTEFALPDANWSYAAPNDFVKLFWRISKASPADINLLRGFTQPFSGYNLFNVCDGKGLSSAEMQFDDDFERKLAEALVANNRQFVDEYKAQITGLPPQFIFRPPLMLGEVGHNVGGYVVNHDVCMYQERINLFYKSGLAERVKARIEANGEVKICEIGAGYGALCYWFKEAFPNASYTIIDLPESLLFSKLYIRLTRPDITSSVGLAKAKFGVRFLPNYMAEELDDSFDLIINTLSMSEMTEYQVRKYVSLMKTSWLKGDGIFFEQNQDNSHMNLLFAEEIFSSEFPYHQSLNANNATYRNGRPNLWGLKPFELV